MVSCTVEMGDAHRPLPRDPQVARLVCCMYETVAPISPSAVCRYVLRGDWSVDALGRPWTDDLPLHHHHHHLNTTTCCSHEDSRFATARLSHVAANLVQMMDVLRTTSNEMVVGYPRSSFSFSSVEEARLAVAIDRTHRTATIDDVLRCLSRALDHGNLLHGVCGPLKPLCVNHVVRALDGPLLVASMDAGRIFDDHSVLTIPVLWSNRNIAVTVTLVGWHWHRDDNVEGCLEHRVVPDCILRNHRQTFGGCIVELRTSDDELDEWWLSTECTRVHGSLYTGHEPLVEDLRLTRKRISEVVPCIDVQDKKVKVVVARWSKSYKSLGGHIPFLLKVLTDTTDERPVAWHDCIVKRCITGNEMRTEGVVRVLTDRFGSGYADAVVNRVKDDPTYAAMVVQTAEGNALAAYVTSLFECVFEDGTTGTAILVDSFAVQVVFSGLGWGSRIFHELVRPSASRRSSRYVIFAQCIAKGDAARFWFDKLDETGVARGLLLQALALDNTRVAVQGSCCSPRARDYYD